VSPRSRQPQHRGPALDRIPTFDSESGCINVVVETPKGSRNKLAYEPAFGALVLKRVLPQGMSFPFDFGFMPATLGDDGDPLDVLVLLDESVPAGVIVPSRLIGVIDARQSEDDGTMVENVRFIAVGERCELFADVKRLSDVPPAVIRQIEHFFISYNEQADKRFEVVGRRGPTAAKHLLEAGRRRFAHGGR
jgi:inorganic pyrophosphatase